MKRLQWKNLLLVAYVFNVLILVGNAFVWKWGYKADRSNLFASNEKQIDNHTLMLEMFHSYMSVVWPS